MLFTETHVQTIHAQTRRT